MYFSERNARIAALLRAPVHQAVLADVEIARAGAAPPVVRLALGDIVLETVDAREAALAHGHDLFKNFDLARRQRFQLPLVPSCMMPTVLVKPSSCARRATASASSGFFTPLPSTELMFT